METTARTIDPAYIGEADPSLRQCRICGGGATFAWQVKAYSLERGEYWTPTYAYCLRCGTRTRDCESFEQARKIWNWTPKARNENDHQARS